MPPRIYRRNPITDALRRVPRSKMAKFARAMIKRAIVWRDVRRERPEIVAMCTRLQLPPKKLVELISNRMMSGEKVRAEEVIAELQEMVEMAGHAGLGPKETRNIFEKAPTIEHARSYIEQLAQGQMQAAA